MADANQFLETGYISSKIHRHYEPKFIGTLPNLVPVRRFAAALKKHDWNRNSHIYHLRCERNQRISVRSERRETFSVLAMAMIAHADYNPERESIFEVICSVEKLAALCSQLHQYENGRKSYDPILNALRDWEAAKLIIIHREFDVEAKQQKAMRIWIRPEFFYGLGFSLKALREISLSFRKWMEKNGLRESYQARYAKHVMRLARSNVASLDNKYALKKLLLKIKRLVINDDEILRQEKQHLTTALAQKKALAKSTEVSEMPAREAWCRYQRWKSQQPIVVVLAFEERMKQQYPSALGDERYVLYLRHLPHP